MRGYQLQTTQKDHYAFSNRQSKSVSDKKLQKVTKKTLNSSFSSLSEDVIWFESPKDSIDSPSVTENSDENFLSESAADFSVLPTPAPAIISEVVASSEISSLSSVITSDEPKDVIASASQCRTAKEETVKLSSIEAEVVMKSLRETQLQVLNAKNMDWHSKRVLDALVNIYVEDDIQLTVEKDWFNELMSRKGYLVIMCFFLWILAVFAVVFNSSHSRVSSIGSIPT